jgi:hypothetical protein
MRVPRVADGAFTSSHDAFALLSTVATAVGNAAVD